MSSTYTPYLGLRKPEHRDPETYDSWDLVVNTNMDQIDTAFGERQYTEQNYILNSDPHSLSLDKLDMKLKDVSDLAPTADEKNALSGGSSSNPFVKLNDVQGNKSLILFPEFAGGTFQASGSNNTGNITVGSELISNVRHNFYKWLSSEGTIQNYDIFVQVKIPDGWTGWRTSGDTSGLKIAIKTEDTDPANSHVGITLQKDGSAPGSILDNQKSDSAEVWKTISIAKTDPVLSTLGAGDTLNIQITMNSLGKYVEIGAITLQYVGF